MKNFFCLFIFSLFSFSLFYGCQGEIQNVSEEEKTVTSQNTTSDKKTFTDEDITLLYKDNVKLREEVEKLKKEMQRFKELLSRSETRTVEDIDTKDGKTELTEDSSKEAIQDIIVQMRQGANKTKIAEQLKPFGKNGVATVVKLLDDYELRRYVEELLTILPKEDTLPIIRQCLTDRVKRIPAVRVLGVIGTEDDITLLEKLIDDKDKYFVLTIAEALAKLKSKNAIPVLISFLRSDDDADFSIAFTSLKKATGQDFGFKSWETDKAKRLEAARKFEEWWEQNKDSFEFK